MTLIRQLKEHNLNVATIKHSHHKLDVVSRKDGHKLGTLAPNLTVGRDRMILDEPIQIPPNLFELVDRFYADMDVVLVESWRDESIPTLLIATPPPHKLCLKECWLGRRMLDLRGLKQCPFGEWMMWWIGFANINKITTAKNSSEGFFHPLRVQ